jgi:uncharacterized membrane protein YphA (DoxX/SURF4 family)
MVGLEWLTGLVLTVGFLVTGGMKLVGHSMTTRMAETLGYAERRVLIGVAEVLGAIGVFVGVITDSLEWLGIAAGVGLVAMMSGALLYHQQIGDQPRDMVPAMIAGTLAIAYIIALIRNGVPVPA